LVYPVNVEVREIVASLDSNIFIKTLNLQLLALIIIGLVGLLFGRNNSFRNTYTCSSTLSDYTERSTRIVGMVMTMVGGISFLYFSMNRIILSLQYGYGGMLNSEAGIELSSQLDVVSLISTIFIPGLILLYISYKKSRYSILFPIIILASGVLASLAGARINIIITTIVLFWLLSNEKGIKAKTIVKLIPVMLLALIFIFSLRNIRDTTDRNLSMYFENTYTIVTDGKVFEEINSTIQEFGSNYFSLYETMRIVPDEYNYRFGLSYALSVPYLFPPIREYFDADNNWLNLWLQEEKRLNYDPAYTSVAESYINFGYFGLVIIFAYFGLISSYYSNGNRTGFNKSIKNAFVAIAMISLTLGAVTHQFQFVLTRIMLTIIIPWLAIIALSSRKNWIGNE
jgi:hypothetical protein